jgi:hypothetical protein
VRYLILVLLLTIVSSARADVQLEELARVGVLDGAPEYTFGWISQVVALPDGRVIAADAQLKCIREYDSSGVYLGDFGGEGEGPGEFRLVYAMRTVAGERLAVLSMPARITLYDPESRRYLRYFDTQGSSNELEADNDGFLYLRAIENPRKPHREWKFAWIKFDQSGKSLGHIPIPAKNPSSDEFGLILPTGPCVNFVTETLSIWSPLGVLVSGRNDEYSFTVGSGPEAVHVSHEVPRVRIGRKEREQWQAWADHFNKNSQDRKHYVIPEYKPAFRALYADPKGRIWVYRYVEAIDTHAPPRAPGDNRPLTSWREPAVFDVFSSEGQFLGTVSLPDFPRIEETAIAGNHIWGVETTEIGNQLVHWLIHGLGEVSPSTAGGG